MDKKLETGAPMWGSDVMAQALKDLDLRYVALNPGASFRGLHDSLVNYTDNDPQLLLCVHEEAAVAIAHGYAKVTGKPMGVALHSNVGLMHGSMGIYNAWCDRVPMVVVGATGPVDASERRPWIDWIHTSQDQGALIREFVKWDDQPGGIAAARLSLFEASARAQTAPRGPAYVNLDAALQEQRLEKPLPEIEPARYAAPRSPAPDAGLVAKTAAMLEKAASVVVMVGRVSRDREDWDRRIALVERLGARVLTDFKAAAAFPSDHPAVAGKAGYFLDVEAKQALKEADLILNLDWMDFGGTLRSVLGDGPVGARLVTASLDVHNHRGWVKDGGAPAPSDVLFLNEPDSVVGALLDRHENSPRSTAKPAPSAAGQPVDALATPTPQTIAAVLRQELGDQPSCLIRAPLSWTGADWPVSHPLGSLGYDGGGGIGSGPGMAVGAALALRDTHPEILPLAVLGDGDFLMNASAIWTAVNQSIPLLIVVVNNHSFYNDEVHQESVARQRGRPVENKTVGIVMNGPEIDISTVAEGFGAHTLGRLNSNGAFRRAIGEALVTVRAGGVAVLEVEAEKGYAPSMNKALRSGAAE